MENSRQAVPNPTSVNTSPEPLAKERISQYLIDGLYSVGTTNDAFGQSTKATQKTVLDFILRRNWPLKRAEANPKATAHNATEGRRLQETFRKKLVKGSFQFFLPPRTRRYNRHGKTWDSHLNVRVNSSQVLCSSEQFMKTYEYSLFVLGQDFPATARLGEVLRVFTNKAINQNLVSWKIDYDSSGFLVVLFFESYITSEGAKLGYRQELNNNSVLGLRFTKDETGLNFDQTKSFLVQQLSNRTSRYADPFSKMDATLYGQLSSTYQKHSYCVVYNLGDLVAKPFTTAQALESINELVQSFLAVELCPEKVVTSYRAPLITLLKTLVAQANKVSPDSFQSYTDDVVTVFMDRLYNSRNLWTDLFPDRNKASVFFNSKTLLNGAPAINETVNHIVANGQYITYWDDTFVKVWSATFHEEMITTLSGRTYSHNPWAVRKTISNWHDLIINTWEDQYTFPFDKESITSTLNEFITFYVGSYRFYSLFKELFSDDLSTVDQMYSPHYIFHAARVGTQGGDCHKNDVLTAFVALFERLRPLASLDKIRRYFLEVFPPMENFQDLDEPMPLLHAHWSDISRRITDTLTGLDSFARYVADGTAVWEYINFSNCRTVAILHDIVAVANNSLSHPPIPNQNPIYKQFTEDTSLIPKTPFEIVIPESSNTLRAWGTEQGHCIGNFADNVNTPEECYIGIRHITTQRWLGHILAKGKLNRELRPLSRDVRPKIAADPEQSRRNRYSKYRTYSQFLEDIDPHISSFNTMTFEDVLNLMKIVAEGSETITRFRARLQEAVNQTWTNPESQILFFEVAQTYCAESLYNGIILRFTPESKTYFHESDYFARNEVYIEPGGYLASTEVVRKCIQSLVDHHFSSDGFHVDVTPPTPRAKADSLLYRLDLKDVYLAADVMREKILFILERCSNLDEFFNYTFALSHSLEWNLVSNQCMFIHVMLPVWLNTCSAPLGLLPIVSAGFNNYTYQMAHRDNIVTSSEAKADKFQKAIVYHRFTAWDSRLDACIPEIRRAYIWQSLGEFARDTEVLREHLTRYSETELYNCFDINGIFMQCRTRLAPAEKISFTPIPSSPSTADALWVKDWAIEQFYGRSNSEINEPLRSHIITYVTCVLNGVEWVDPEEQDDDEFVKEKELTEGSVEHPELTKD